MKHDDAALLLPELHRGALPDAERAEVQAHLESCPECAALDRAYLSIDAAMRADLEESGHPSVEDVVSFAVHRDRLDRDSAQRIASHMELCESCREEADRTRRADEPKRAIPVSPDTEPSGDAVARHGAARYLGLAAAIALVALLYPAFLGLFRVPALSDRVQSLTAARTGMESEIRQLEQSLENARATMGSDGGWSGALSLNLLSSTLRGGGGPPRIELSALEPFVAFGVEFDLPETLIGSEELRFRFTDERGGTAAELLIPAAEARQAIRAAGVVTILLPSEKLSEGTYELEVTRPDAPEAKKLLRVAFDVVRIDTP